MRFDADPIKFKCFLKTILGKCGEIIISVPVVLFCKIQITFVYVSQFSKSQFSKF